MLSFWCESWNLYRDAAGYGSIRSVPKSPVTQSPSIPKAHPGSMNCSLNGQRQSIRNKIIPAARRARGREQGGHWTARRQVFLGNRAGEPCMIAMGAHSHIAIGDGFPRFGFGESPPRDQNKPVQIAPATE